MINIKMNNDKVKLKMDGDTPIDIIKDFITVVYCSIEQIGNKYDIDKNLILEDINDCVSDLIKDNI